jgi:hypothetical protein
MKNNYNKKDKTRFDFKYFFVNTFIEQKRQQEEKKYNNINNEFEESNKVIKLKRERLFTKDN